MKNKKLVLLSAIVLIVAMTGSAVAYMFRQASAVENTFIPAIVDCEVGETFDGTVKTDIWTTNTGTVDAYIRLRLVTYWADKNGVAVAMEAAMPEFTITGQWLKDASENTYYYKEPVKPKAKTTNLLESNIILGTKVVNDVTYYQVVEVFAEAIQSQPEKAVENSWGVTVENDAITAVP